MIRRRNRLYAIECGVSPYDPPQFGVIVSLPAGALLSVRVYVLWLTFEIRLMPRRGRR